MVADGDTVALGGALSWRQPMAQVREIVRQGRRGLRLIGSAHGIDVDLLVAAGAVRTSELSYVGFEQDFGLAPAYRRACERGEIEIRETCCYTLLQQLRAAEFGAPYMPVRSVLGTDVMHLHPEYREAVSPFDGEPVVLVPALAPEVALIHGSMADRHGNVHLEQPYVLDERYARAARAVLVTVERIVGHATLREAGITLPAQFVTAVAEVPLGAHPTSCYPAYAYDREHIAGYVAAAQEGGDALGAYLDRYVRGTTEEGYRTIVGEARARTLRGWSESTRQWEELFA
jgi:glutaconate CoA-transferase subunit A